MLYHAIVQRRVAKSGVKLDIPVISVGNINLGGTGKTPTVIALVDIARNLGIEPTILMRGYGGNLEGPVKVSANHTADHVGDEAVLLSAFATVWVSKDRASGAEVAVADGAKLLILDDALQNPAIDKNLSLCVVDAQTGFGNGSVFPAGPLRERVTSGLSRSDLVVLVGTKERQEMATIRWPELNGETVLHAEIKPLETGMDWRNEPVLAFAGIGRPEKFFASLKAVGADIRATRSFGDHQKIPEQMLKRLLSEASGLGAQLVTTEKDAARLPAHWQQQVLTFPVRLEFENPTLVKDRVKDILND